MWGFPFYLNKFLLDLVPFAVTFMFNILSSFSPFLFSPSFLSSSFSLLPPFLAYLPCYFFFSSCWCLGSFAQTWCKKLLKSLPAFWGDQFDFFFSWNCVLLPRSVHFSEVWGNCKEKWNLEREVAHAICNLDSISRPVPSQVLLNVCIICFLSPNWEGMGRRDQRQTF